MRSDIAPSLDSIRAFVAEMQPTMRLTEWRIDIEATPSNDYTMSVRSTPEYRWATIYVSPDTLNGESCHDWHQSVIHELVHIYGHPYRKQFNALQEKVPEELRDLIKDSLRMLEEAIVEETSRTIWRLYQRAKTAG